MCRRAGFKRSVRKGMHAENRRGFLLERTKPANGVYTGHSNLIISAGCGPAYITSQISLRLSASAVQYSLHYFKSTAFISYAPKSNVSFWKITF
jgi:hypothetical protein